MAPAPRYHPSLFWLSLLTAAIAFVLIGSGGTVTSMGVGMVDPEWSIPVQLFMHWLEVFNHHRGLFVEHSHRLLAALVGLLSLVVAVLCFVKERPGSRKWLGLVPFLAVSIQGGLGAVRILLNQGIISPILGQDYAMVHGFVGQVTFALLAICTLAFSRSWVQGPRFTTTLASAVYALAMLLSILFLVQLTLAVLVRHYGGDLLLISHASMAGLIVVVTTMLLAKARGAPSGLIRRPVWALAGLVLMMIVLGTSAWWFGAGYGPLSSTSPNSHRVALATAHQWLGALTLATSMIITLRTRRHLIPPETAPALPEGVA